MISGAVMVGAVVAGDAILGAVLVSAVVSAAVVVGAVTVGAAVAVAVIFGTERTQHLHGREVAVCWRLSDSASSLVAACGAWDNCGWRGCGTETLTERGWNLAFAWSCGGSLLERV
jgi:hypothetical protein